MLDYLDNSSRIFEINSNEESPYYVPTDPRINVQELTADDENPMFVTMEIIRNGMSRNKRNYPVSVVQELKDKVVGTFQYLGHSDPKKSGFEYRNPEGILVGSSLLTEADGTVRLLGKSYIFKNSSLREHLPKAFACGNPLTVSIQGKAKCFENLDKTIEVASIEELESVDFCNAGTQGMMNSTTLALTTEMLERSLEDMEEKILEQVEEPIEEKIEEQVAEPVEEKIEEIIEEPVDNKVTEMTSQISEMETKISEMETTISEKDARISELEKEIQEMKDAQLKAELDAYKADKIAEQVDEAHREVFESKINGTSKEEIDSQISELVDFCKNMGVLFDNAPVKPQQRKIETDNVREQVVALFSGK